MPDVDLAKVRVAIAEEIAKAQVYEELADELRYQADEMDRRAADSRCRADNLGDYLEPALIDGHDA